MSRVRKIIFNTSICPSQLTEMYNFFKNCFTLSSNQLISSDHFHQLNIKLTMNIMICEYFLCILWWTITVNKEVSCVSIVTCNRPCSAQTLSTQQHHAEYCESIYGNHQSYCFSPIAHIVASQDHSRMDLNHLLTNDPADGDIIKAFWLFSDLAVTIRLERWQETS